MQEINEELENDRSVLEWMLGQYVRAKRRKKQLEVRLLEINAERDSPIGGQGYDPLPRSGGNNEGAAGILMKLADIEDRIYEQKAKADKSMVNVATILNFLPEESMEREICELRHLDGHEWGNMDRHGFILIGLRRQSCRNAVGGMLCTGLLCHGVGLMDRGKTFLHHIPVQVTFRRHGRHLCKGLLDFLFRREIPESGRSSSQYKYNRGGCGYAVKPRRKKKRPPAFCGNR